MLPLPGDTTTSVMATTSDDTPASGGSGETAQDCVHDVSGDDDDDMGEV